jgi:hypothetical protein
LCEEFGQAIRSVRALGQRAAGAETRPPTRRSSAGASVALLLISRLAPLRPSPPRTLTCATPQAPLSPAFTRLSTSPPPPCSKPVSPRPRSSRSCSMVRPCLPAVEPAVWPRRRRLTIVRHLFCFSRQGARPGCQLRVQRRRHRVSSLPALPTLVPVRPELTIRHAPSALPTIPAMKTRPLPGLPRRPTQSLQAMDNSHVALVSVLLKASGFENYRCDRSMPLGINVRPPVPSCLARLELGPFCPARERGRDASLMPPTCPRRLLAARLVDQDSQVRKRLGHCHAQGCR